MSSSSESSSSQVLRGLPNALGIRLTGKNYPMWKVKIRAVLQSQDLLDCLIGGHVSSSLSLQADDGGKKKEADLLMKSRCARAYTIILLSLDDTRIQMVMDVAEGDSVGLWSALMKLFERTTTASKTHTRRMLHQIKMDVDEEFDLFKSRIIQLVTRLNSMGENVTDGEKIYAVLEGLPRSYDGLKQSLEVQDSLTFEEICSHIRDHQEKLEYRIGGADEVSGTEVANYANGGGRGGRGGDNGGRVNTTRGGMSDASSHRCYLCRKYGHYEWSCDQRRGRDGDCFRCGKPGHQMRECKGVVPNGGNGKDEIACGAWKEGEAGAGGGDDDSDGWAC
jgi:hypothetical protein